MITSEAFMKGRIFGTDGIRGVAGPELSPELALRTGEAVVEVLAKKTGTTPLIVVGRDTRRSGPMLESALSAGISAAGGTCECVGVMPTPVLAYLVKELGAGAGIMISASHNSFEDNGIKIFSSDGFKLPDSTENEIELHIRSEKGFMNRVQGSQIGEIKRESHYEDRYFEYLKGMYPLNLKGIKIALDCANGATCSTAPNLFESLGADVSAYNINPDGKNINNNCGATNPEALAERMKKSAADIGFTFDGDGDRVIAVDGNCTIRDGDFLIAVCAIHMLSENRLKKNAVVSTVMANMGFLKAMEAKNVDVVTTGVGDRYVLEEMVKNGMNLGGEQSGHVIFLDRSTTGDGLLTALEVMKAVVETKKGLEKLSEIMIKYPQILINIKVKDKSRLENNADIKRVIAEQETRLGDCGRVLVRTSGTEPLVRVMVEASEEDSARNAAEAIASVVSDELS